MSSALPNVIAHRGGKVWAPENTLSAFRKSLEAKVFGVELDIHRCSSGELVVIHDDDVQRTTNGVGLVKDISFDELRRLDAGSWYSAEFTAERIPLLSEVLQLIDGGLVINIEIKNTPIDYPGIDEDLIELLKGYKHTDKIIVSSFDHNVVHSVAKKASNLQTALLSDSLFYGLQDYAQKVGSKVWHPAFGSLRNDAVQEAHAAGIQVNAWTVNDPREWASAVEMKLDGIVTDDPPGLVSYLERVGKVRSLSS